ncbi:VWA containing CoxE family protein [Pseudomonas aeruginosa]|nr:VWA containing CoxE family protein [Pseudomonas aeruginosa]
MLLNLFNEMRAAKVPVSVRELLDLIDALKHRVVFADMDEFYYLARTIMVKDERHFDKFDRAFGAYFKGLEKLDDHLKALIPEEWLRKEFERLLTDEEKGADPVPRRPGQADRGVQETPRGTEGAPCRR